MLKRFMILLTALLLCCGAAAAEGRVAPADLNRDEENMLALMSLEYGTSILDFTMPDGAKTVILTLWALDDGAWEERSVTTLTLEDNASGRIALRSEDCLGADLYQSIWTEDGYVSGADDNEPEFDLWSMNGGTDWLCEEVLLTLDSVQPLALQAFTAAPDVPDFDLSGFESPEKLRAFDHVYVVTLSFSELTEEQLYGWEE